MTVFVDSSGLISMSDRAQPTHGQASAAWQQLGSEGVDLITTNYVLVETFAVLQKRFGWSMVRLLHERIHRVLRVIWVTPEMHEQAREQVFATAGRDLSLVDAVSFEVMAREATTHALAFDKHFTSQGFSLPQSPTH